MKHGKYRRGGSTASILQESLLLSEPHSRSVTVIYSIRMHVLAKSLQSCPTLCNPMDCSPRDSSVHGILQARILEWVTMPSSRGSSQPRDRTCVSYVSCIGRQVLYHLGSPSLTYAAAAAKSLQSCPTLCDPIDGSPPGSPVPGILQARTLEWVAISFSNA